MRMWIRTGAAAAASANRASGFTQNIALAGDPREEELTQRPGGRRIGDDQRVLKALGARAAVPPLEKRRHRVGVRSPREAGIDGERTAGFQILELEIASVRKFDLLTAENLEQHDLVTSP